MELGPGDFNGQTLKRQGTLAVLFLASWCPFCWQGRRAFEAAARTNNAPWASVDVSEDDSVFWDVFNLSIVPTVVVFRDGKVIFRRDGVRGRGLSQDAMREAMDHMKSSATS
jgi:thioredoxin 1